MADFLMPSLGADMDEGTVLEWLVRPGSVVHRGDVVAVVDTAKSAVDVEVFEDGVVEQILVPAGERVPVGTPLATIAPAGAAVTPEVSAPAPAAARGGRFPAQQGPLARRRARQPAPPRTAPQPARPRVSPLARRRAAELGVDLAAVAAGLPADSVVDVAAVEAAAAATPASPPVSPPVTPEHVAAAEPVAAAPPETGAAAARSEARRRTTAALMARSKREVPHYYVGSTIDVSATMAWLRAHNDRSHLSERILPTAAIAKAVVRAAVEVPGLNGWWVDDELRPSAAVHLGITVALHGGGLVTPAVLDAEALSLPELMARLKDVTARSRRGVLHRRELTDASLTLSALGELGADEVYGVVFPPQVALVGVGRVVDRPWAVDGLLGIRPTVRITVSGDHRASDGHVASTYLAAVARLLQDPGSL